MPCVSVTPGNYWIGLWSNSTFANTNVVSMSNMMLAFNANGGAAYNGMFGQAANATQGVQEGVGILSGTTASLPSTAAFSKITQSAFASVSAPYMNFKNITW